MVCVNDVEMCDVGLDGVILGEVGGLVVVDTIVPGV